MCNEMQNICKEMCKEWSKMEAYDSKIKYMGSFLKRYLRSIGEFSK